MQTEPHRRSEPPPSEKRATGFRGHPVRLSVASLGSSLSHELTPTPFRQCEAAKTNGSECPVRAGACGCTLALDGDIHVAAKEEGQAEVEASGTGASEVVERVVRGRKELVRIGDAEGDGARNAVGPR